MKPILTAFFIGLFGSVMTCGSVWAQATAQISGSIQDQSGAVLPGAEVTATQTDTGIGEVSEQVEVQANAALVETRSVSVGQVMETARIMELPLNGRNAQELLLLGGGAVQTAPAGGMSFPFNRLTISSAGALGTATEYTLDGIRHVDPYDGVPLPLPFPDALGRGKQNHFSIVEVWESQKAFDGHSALDHTKRFGKRSNQDWVARLTNGCITLLSDQWIDTVL